MQATQQKRQEKLDQINSLPHSNTLTNKPPEASALDLPKPNTMGGQYQPPSKSMLPPLEKAATSSTFSAAANRLQQTMTDAVKSTGLAIYQQGQSVSDFLGNGAPAPAVDLRT